MPAVLFDLYETLVRPVWPRLRDGRARLAARVGLDWELMRELWERTLPERTVGANGSLEADLAAILTLAGRQVSDHELAALARFEEATWRQGVELYPDTLLTLRELRSRGVATAIVSNCSYEAGAVVHELGLDAEVDLLVLSCLVGLAKPDPAIFRLTLDRLGTSAEQALFVDDRLENVESARRLGLSTLLIARPESTGDGAAGAESVGDLSSLLSTG
ncbi:MAG: HAD-IA family hydrolase [Chloroflexi bacterium]|nr:HAD-IA family hydrolase [Chloroflexota bacterium]